MFWISIVSFVLFTGLVALGTYLICRKRENSSQDGFFLAGRSLTFPVIAGSLLLTNLSTEQMVGLNGSAFKEGMAVMAWEVVAVVALVLMALWFLPKFLKGGITTVPEFLRRRFDEVTASICNGVFLLSYAVILLPIILYTGARGMIDILDLGQLIGVQNEVTQLYIIVVAVALIGAAYALFGGLNSCAVSDTLNGIGLFIGGFLISYYAFSALGDGEFAKGVQTFFAEGGDRLNSIGANDSEAPFFGLFTGILLIHTFYWCTNQQIIQRTLGAKSLAEGQKGVLLTGAFKLLGPIYLVIPGIIAAMLFMKGSLNIPLNSAGVAVSDKAYGALVNMVLPAPLKGFFAAVLLGAILSSYNSVLNSTCTLFSLDIYKRWINKTADDRRVVKMGQLFGFIATIASIIIAPMLMNAGSIFGYLQSMNGLTFIPLLAVVVAAMTTSYVPARAANTVLIGGITLNALGYFVKPFSTWANAIGQFHFVAIVFAIMLLAMLVWGKIAPRETPYEEVDAKVIDMTPWKHAKAAAVILLVIIGLIYAAFADFGVFKKGKAAYPAREVKTTQTAK
ncbi:MAG: solute:sodium symporter family transporter [Lentisphaeria bacterium]|nr:solute:sodium symporter family transporter [Lentisphaeria bacterium]MBR7145446.1 solute:sodium symporter family transporter [Lentisphaeria bacterium]